MDSTTTKVSGHEQPATNVGQAGASLADGTSAGMQLSQAITHYRWVICALLFFATTINYVDRQIIGLLKQTLQGQIGWNEIDYSNIIFAFQLAYAVGLLFAGRVMDRLG